MRPTLSTLKAVWPVLRRAIASGQLFRPQCEMVAPDPDIAVTWDVRVPMSEGYALTAQVFRSRRRMAAGERDPVIMCAHPYDNRKIAALGNTPLGGPPAQYRLLPQVGPRPRFSTQTSWEAPDPNLWVPAGYTLVNLNLPGFGDSGGPASILSAHQGRCFREAIAWAGAQDWSTGAVGLCGVSFLCMSQYLAAAAPEGEALPDALKCIVPWEGVSDLYRELACRGGIADTGFLSFWWETEVQSSLNVSLEEYLAVEEHIPVEALAAHPFYDDYWRAKVPPLERINVPMLVCGSFSDHELHTFGSFRAYEKAEAAQKWLYTHRSGKWTEFYRTETTDLIRAFLDHFLKGETTGFADNPPVRLEVRSTRDRVHAVRWESAWPLPRTEYRPLYLSANGGLGPDRAGVAESASYSAATGHLAFEHVFAEDTELSGYMKLSLWVAAEGAADMALCCFVDKRDSAGRSVRFNGSAGQTEDMVTRGYGRATRRQLDEAASTPWHPVPLCEADDPLGQGEIVRLEIALCPSSTFFAAGERL
ncbi:MAG: CocE/NonD family hydrolase, partial [Pseudomonadota bacterium]